MSGVVVAIAEALRWPIAILLLWITAGALAAAHRCRWAPLALVLLDLGDMCSRSSRAMLPLRKGPTA